eukprot:3745071-Pyramimonas_sp.AAC.1
MCIRDSVTSLGPELRGGARCRHRAASWTSPGVRADQSLENSQSWRALRHEQWYIRNSLPALKGAPGWGRCR